MVRKYTKDGYPYDEPPYTEEELEDLYRRLDGGPVAIVYSGPAGQRNKAPPPPKPRQDDDDLLD
jgi:hypothetical protein